MMGLVRNRIYTHPLPPPNSLTNQHILVTGGNTGLGRETALHCLNLGAKQVIITSRDVSKGEEAKAYLETSTTGIGTVKVMHLDMATFAGVKDFVDRLEKEESMIDVVFLNAGVQSFPGYAPTVSKDGWEMTLQVNTLSTILLALLLLPWLKSAGKGKAHMGFTGSGMHRGIDISAKSGWPQQDVLKHWRDPKNYEKAGGVAMYSISKLLLEYGMREIAKLAVGTDGRPEVIVTSCCPGPVKTELARQVLKNPVMGFVGRSLLTVFAKPTAQGAVALVHAAYKKPEEHGTFYTFYLAPREYEIAAEKSVLGLDGQRMQKQVWEETIALLTEQIPEIKQIAHWGNRKP